MPSPSAKFNTERDISVLDCPVYYGNSGGPVIEVDQASMVTTNYMVIGVVSEFVPFLQTWYNVQHKYQNVNIENSGYSIVSPMDHVIELIGEWDDGRDVRPKIAARDLK